MIMLDVLVWWYKVAWVDVLHDVQQRTIGVFQSFSVVLLLKTLFAPFRQIDAGGVRGPINVQIRAWFDRSFSRVLGAAVRSIVIIAGCLTGLLVLLLGAIWAAAWLVIPLLPVAGIIIMVVT